MELNETLADVIVVVHTAYVLYVVLGQAAIVLGMWRGWAWIRNFWFRVSHLIMMSIVAIESIFAFECPLSTWERELRESTGQQVDQTSFLGRFFDRYFFVATDQHHELMLAGYLLFTALVIGSWALAPPRWKRWVK